MMMRMRRRDKSLTRNTTYPERSSLTRQQRQRHQTFASELSMYGQRKRLDLLSPGVLCVSSCHYCFCYVRIVRLPSGRKGEGAIMTVLWHSCRRLKGLMGDRTRWTFALILSLTDDQWKGSLSSHKKYPRMNESFIGRRWLRIDHWCGRRPRLCVCWHDMIFC